MQGHILVCYEWHMRIYGRTERQEYCAFSQRPLCICNILRSTQLYVRFDYCSTEIDWCSALGVRWGGAMGAVGGRGEAYRQRLGTCGVIALQIVGNVYLGIDLVLAISTRKQ